jgi:hypothetical protein
MIRVLAGATALLLAACKPPVRLVRMQPCPAAGLESERIPLALAVPHPEGLFIPPMPISTRVRGNHLLIKLVIDTSGRVMPDSVTICGITDPLYAQRVAEEVSHLRFRPGLMYARHVIAPALLSYDF